MSSRLLHCESLSSPVDSELPLASSLWSSRLHSFLLFVMSSICPGRRLSSWCCYVFYLSRWPALFVVLLCLLSVPVACSLRGVVMSSICPGRRLSSWCCYVFYLSRWPALFVVLPLHQETVHIIKVCTLLSTIKL